MLSREFIVQYSIQLFLPTYLQKLKVVWVEFEILPSHPISYFTHPPTVFCESVRGCSFCIHSCTGRKRVLLATQRSGSSWKKKKFPFCFLPYDHHEVSWVSWSIQIKSTQCFQTNRVTNSSYLQAFRPRKVLPNLPTWSVLIHLRR